MNPELLKHVRLICGYPQTELASIINVHQSLIAKMEAGTIPIQPETERKMLLAFAEKGIGTKEIALLASVFESRKPKRRHR